jgi:hypothetical protein
MAKKKRDEGRDLVMASLHRFAIPGILYLLERGLDLSGVTNIYASAAVWSVASIWGVAAFFTWPPIVSRLSAMWRWITGGVATVILFVVIYFVLFATSKTFEGNAIAYWGTSEAGSNSAHVIVNTAMLSRYRRDFRILVLYTVVDNYTEPRNDTRIVKSEPFEIVGERKRIHTQLSQSFMHRLVPTGFVQVYLILIPLNIKPESVLSVNDALSRGGILAGVRGMQVTAFTKNVASLKAQAEKLGIKEPQITSVDLKPQAMFPAIFSQRDRPDSFVQLDYNIEEVGKDTITVAIRGSIFDRGKLWDQFEKVLRVRLA